MVFLAFQHQYYKQGRAVRYGSTNFQNFNGSRASAVRKGISSMGKRTSGGRKRNSTLAAKADRHILYQDSVQCAEADIDFIDETYKGLRKRTAKILREDFCGTALTACEWVRRRSSNRAYGIDIDGDVLAWGTEHNLSKLGRAAKRISLVQADVLQVSTPTPDIVLAMNFSYWCFKTRKRLRGYFKGVRRALAKSGLLIIDIYGGYEAFRVTKDRHKNKAYTYIWDQAGYDPITGDMLAHIHFSFPDGSRIKRAFSYDWRLWSIPELQELLDASGFHRSTVYWQGEDENGEGDGIFEPATKGEPDAAWIAYLVAEK